MSTHTRSFRPVSRLGATLAASGLAAGIVVAGATTASAGAHQGLEPCSALQPGTDKIVGGDVVLLPSDTPGDGIFHFTFGPTEGPAIVNYSVDWQNHTTGENGSFIGSTLPDGDATTMNQSHPTGAGHVTWQVTDFELVSVDRPDIGGFAGVGCAGEQHLPV